MRTRGETSTGRDGRAQKQKLAGAMLAVRLLGRSLTREQILDNYESNTNATKKSQTEQIPYIQIENKIFIGDKIVKEDSVQGCK